MTEKEIVTPTDDELRFAWRAIRSYPGCALVEPDWQSRVDAEFDRWLSGHNRKIVDNLIRKILDDPT